MWYIISLYAPIYHAIIKTLCDRNNSYTIVKCKIPSHLRESRPHALYESTRQVNINSQIDNKHQLAYSTQTTTRFHLFSSMSNEDETLYDLLSLFLSFPFYFLSCHWRNYFLYVQTPSHFFHFRRFLSFPAKHVCAFSLPFPSGSSCS